MKTCQLITMMFAVTGTTYAAVPDCLAVCAATAACATDSREQSSYCKDWQTIPVCFGMYVRPDGTYCYQPNDATCDDMVLPPLGCSGAATTLAPTTVV